MTPDDPQLARMRHAFSEELERIMTAAGWQPDLAQSHLGLIGAYRLPVVDDFVAAVTFSQAGPGSAHELPLRVSGWLGVDFEPAYRLAPLVLGKPSMSECDVSIGDLLDPPSMVSAEASSPSDVPAAAAELCTPVITQADAYVRDHASIDALLESARRDPELTHEQVIQVPLLLAAAGRHREAAVALEEFESAGSDEVGDREYRRFARQLRIWMDEGADLPNPPTGPVNPYVPHSERPRPHRDREARRARREIFDEVRAHCAGKTPDQLRAELLAEAARRELAADPLWLESSVDALRHGPHLSGATATAQATYGALAGIARSVRLLSGLFTGAEPPEPPRTPEWLEPPDVAAFPADERTTDEWLTVVLDPGVDPYLDTVHAALPSVIPSLPFLPKLLNTVILDAWLSPSAQFLVHLGERAIGHLDAEGTEQYGPILALAQQRHELPRVKARLTAFDHTPRFLLQVNAAQATGQGDQTR